MKKPLGLPCLLAASLFLASCNKYIYVPNTVNAPLLKEKHELKASISPTNYQAAFAVANKIAIMANGQYVYRWDLNDNDTRSNDDDLFLDKHTRGGVFEGAVGFFQPLDTKKRMIFDTYAGFGAGRFKTLDRAFNDDGSTGIVNDYQLTTRFSKFFVQPSIGFVHPVFEAVFSSRVSVLNFYGMGAGDKAFAGQETQRAEFLRISNGTHALLEPAFTFRVGYKYVKFQSQFSFMLPFDDATYGGYELNEYFQPVSVGMGVSINIGQWYNKQ
ncbi:hypothetical protein [uncultured Chitinophaga sp.]|jgi:hypothetical protein|uniref:hypothetical protein n=1 Tax=uncultured Chitinophaga sp. TaxID=339340 RepID=UPI0026269F16|nr:hypothetical protein [uncultured Chitinophaga sp.]